MSVEQPRAPRPQPPLLGVLDLPIVLSLLGGCLLLLLWSWRDAGEGRPRRLVVVHPGGRMLLRLPSAASGSVRIAVRGRMGDTIVEVSSKGARIVSSPCPLHLCISRGWLLEPGDTAACVPNGVVIRLEAAGAARTSGGGGVDAVTR